MRILIVSHYFWPEQFRVNDLAVALSKRGHDVAVLTGMPNYPTGKMFAGYSWWAKRRDDMQGVPIFRVPLFLRREGRGWQLALNFLSFVFFACLMAPWYFRKRSFDVVFVYEPSPFTVGIPAALMRRLKRAPMLFWVQDLWPESLEAAGAVRSPMVLRAVGRVVRWIYRRCDRVLVQSKSFVEPAVAAGAAKERTYYFPNWAESLYQPMSLPADAPEYEGLPAGFRIMFAGNLGEAQSLETIVSAADQLKQETDIHWLIVGDGRRRAWFEKEVRSRGLEHCVHFLGRHPAEKMPHYFATADALLVTLKADPVFAMTIPSKVQSYLACGKPILAALNGEGARVIEQSNGGVAVAAEDATALAEAVQKMARIGEGDRRVMGIAGENYYRTHFEREMLISRLETWMQESGQENKGHSI